MTIAELDAICAENARLLGEEQDVFPRQMAGGRIRIQVKRSGRWVRGAYREYSSIEAAAGAALKASARAKRVAEMTANGVPLHTAVRSVTWP